MAQANAHKMVMGRDIVFTLGPYSSIDTRVLTPEIRVLILSSSLFMALAIVAMLTIIFDGGSGWFVVFTTFIAATAPSDARLFVLVIGSATTAILAFVWLRGVARPMAPVALVVPTVSCVAWWMIAGQPVLWLPRFFVRSIPRCSGIFGRDGAVRRQSHGHVARLGGSCRCARWHYRRCAVVRDAAAHWRDSVFVVMFVAFNEGFVREDNHALIFGQAVMLAALLASGAVARRAGWSLFIAALVFVHIDSSYANSTSSDLVNRLAATYQGFFRGMRMQLGNPGTFVAIYRQRLQDIAYHAHLPRIQGRVDIYPVDQSDLIASGNDWSPRPVFQSYSAYTPALGMVSKMG